MVFGVCSCNECEFMVASSLGFGGGVLVDFHGGASDMRELRDCVLRVSAMLYVRWRARWRHQCIKTRGGLARLGRMASQATLDGLRQLRENLAR